MATHFIKTSSNINIQLNKHWENIFFWKWVMSKGNKCKSEGEVQNFAKFSHFEAKNIIKMQSTKIWADQFKEQPKVIPSPTLNFYIVLNVAK